MRGRRGGFRRWLDFMRLTWSPRPLLGLPTTHATEAARKQAVWELTANARGIRRRPMLPMRRKSHA